jgi:hypothetical protein
MLGAIRSLSTRGGRAAALAAGLAATLAAPGTSAQTVKETLDVTRKARESQRRVLVSGALVLTDEESKAFWPLYDDYEKERRGIEEKADRLAADFMAAYTSLSEIHATAMLAEVFRIDEARLKLRHDLAERMSKALPPRKLFRYVQIERKLDAVTAADTAQKIPLVP